MLETKLIVGRFINLAITNAIPPHMPLGSFLSVPVQQCYLQESSGIINKTSLVQTGVGAKAHRNFKWLPWIPGRISEVALVGSDVLTGPMSGCWLVTYRKPNGVPYAAHLGTVVGDEEKTDAVNDAWNNFAIANPGDVIGGFNPARHWNGGIPAAKGKDEAGRPRYFGLYTVSNQFYVVFAYPQQGSPNLLRVAGIQNVPSSTLARLQTVDQPGP